MKKLAALLCLFLVSPGTLSAAPGIKGTHYEESVDFSCGGTWYCVLFFSATPSDKFLMIRYVSCQVMRQSPTHTLYLGVSTVPGQESGARLLPLAINQSGNLSGWFISSASQETEFLVGKSKYPYVRSSTFDNVSGTIRCHISGELID